MEWSPTSGPCLWPTLPPHYPFAPISSPGLLEDPVLQILLIHEQSYRCPQPLQPHKGLLKVIITCLFAQSSTCMAVGCFRLSTSRNRRALMPSKHHVRRHLIQMWMGTNIICRVWERQRVDEDQELEWEEANTRRAKWGTYRFGGWQDHEDKCR